MRRLLLWSEASPFRRWLLIAGLVAVPIGLGLLLARAGLVAIVVVGFVVMASLVWTMATLPAPPQRRWAEYERQFNPGSGPAPCALCGFNCIPGGFWTPVPGFVNAVMHTMGCGPDLPGEEPMAAPTHRREEGGRYRLL